MKNDKTESAGGTFLIVTSQNCFLYETAGLSDAENHSEITDEILSGWAVREIGENAAFTDLPGEGAWHHIETHYGYKGFVHSSRLRPISEAELRGRQDPGRFFLIGQAAVDVLAGTRVQAECLETLLRGSIVEKLDDGQADGWSLIRTASGHEGYVHTHFLVPRMDDDSWLLRALPGSNKPSGTPAGNGGSAQINPDPSLSLFNRNALRVIASVGESELRRRLVESAKSYLGTQYRWAGKSPLGIDCSGLVFMSCMMNGILPYRDAWIKVEHPIREITGEQLRAGDFIFFEGHVAMSLGGLSFIHATGFAQDACVTINSLDPDDPLYRKDLPDKVLWYGSLFRGEYTTKTREDEEAVLKAAKSKTSEAGETESDRKTGKITGKDIGKITGKKNDNPSAAEISENRSAAASAEREALTMIREKLEALGGETGFYYKNLVTGECARFHADRPLPAASVIKIYLMAAMFDAFESGALDPERYISVPDKAKVPSCGVLTYLSGLHEITLRDLVELMIIVSDNTATNLLWDVYEEHFGAGSLTRFAHEVLHCTDTSLNRKMFDAKKAAQGIENYTSARDAAKLLDALYAKTLISPEASAQMLGILHDQRLNGKIPFHLHTINPVPLIAHKTGEDYRITHDVSIIEGDHPMILCFMGSDVDVPALERLMADAAYALYQAG